MEFYPPDFQKSCSFYDKQWEQGTESTFLEVLLSGEGHMCKCELQIIEDREQGEDEGNYGSEGTLWIAIEELPRK